MTIKIYGDIQSGNCYKIKLLANLLDIPHQWRNVNILQQETHTEEFMSINPNGKIPVLVLEDGSSLWESNAILNYLAEGTSFLPEGKLSRAQVLQWQFFEQYSHEPFIAVACYIAKYLGLPKEREAEYHAKQTGGHKALSVMDNHLSQNDYFVGNVYTIADISLYAYTHVASEGGFDLTQYPAITCWIKRLALHPKHISMNQTG